MYSQNLEEKYILDYFRDYPTGKFLDIGAYHPFKLSNTRALFERDWSGIMIEPSPKCMAQLKEEYDNEPKIVLIEAAITDTNGHVIFYEEKNVSAVSTTNISHRDKWASDPDFEYHSIQVKSLSMETLLKTYGQDIDFISIDTENTNYDLFLLLPDLFLQRLHMICIEHDNNHEPMIQKLKKHNFINFNMCGDNLIASK